MNYRGKHDPSGPWPVSSSASSSHRSRHAYRNPRKRRFFIFLLILLAVVISYPFLSARRLTVDRKTLIVDDLPADIARARIVYVTDIHYGYFFSDSQVGGLVDQINSLKPDIVLFGGDYATDNESAIRFFQKLPSIHSRYAVLGVIGESDRGGSDLDLLLLTDAMRSADVVPLVNSTFRVRMGNSSVIVAGLDEPLLGSPDYKGVASQLSADDFVILLAHNPSVIQEVHSTPDRTGRLRWFDLALFGHTHGGQISIAPTLLGIAEDVPARYRGGWFKENRADILVSNGVGTSVFPVRLFCPAQIHCIDISLK